MMKNKEIKKILIEKANQIDVPDLSAAIKNQLHDIPEKAPKHVIKRRLLIPALSLSMIVLIALAITFLGSNQVTDPLLSEDGSTYEAVILSSISTISLVEGNETATTTSLETIKLLAEDTDDEETAITNNVDGLKQYLNIMENVLTANQNFTYQQSTISRRLQKYALTFTTSSLSEEQISYDIVYEVIENTDEVARFSVLITANDQTYETDMSYDKINRKLTMITTNQNNLAIHITYTKNTDQFIYDITTYQADEIIEQVQLSYQNRTNMTLSFIHGNVYGTYQFSLTTGVLGYQNVLLIDYDLQNQYRGNIKISITGQSRNTYRMLITPQGKQSFIITRERQKGKN